ncbi:MAG: MFS transporter, partial [Pseudomonadota bacterium]
SPEYVGSFLLLAIVSLVAAGLLLGLRIPATKAETGTAAVGRPWSVIVAQPAYLVALFGAATGYGVMILAMTATPIAMLHHGHGLAAATTVIQLHVLGMFLPSFFTGSLIARLGVLPVMLAGVALLAGHVLMTLTGMAFESFAGALMMLGVGWNFLYIGGTTLLTTTYTAAEKGRAQATNDMSIFAVGLACSLGAAALLQAFGWQALNLLLLPWLAIAALALLWLGYRRRRTVAAALAD